MKHKVADIWFIKRRSVFHDSRRREPGQQAGELMANFFNLLLESFKTFCSLRRKLADKKDNFEAYVNFVLLKNNILFFETFKFHNRNLTLRFCIVISFVEKNPVSEDRCIPRYSCFVIKSIILYIFAPSSARFIRQSWSRCSLEKTPPSRWIFALGERKKKEAREQEEIAEPIWSLKLAYR